MNQRIIIPRRSRGAMAPCIDRLESRLLLSTAVMSVHEAAQAHHHHPVRQHHPAEVGRTHSGHHGATPDTSTGFQVVAQFNNAAFEATVAIADNDIWAVGTSNPGTSEVPLAVHFNGTSWSAVPTPSEPADSALLGVAAVASNDVWAVGGVVHANNSETTLIENWNGTSWSVVSNPSTSGILERIAAVSANDIWAVGFGSASIENWNGTSWSNITSPIPGGGLRGVTALSDGTVVAVGGGTILEN